MEGVENNAGRLQNEKKGANRDLSRVFGREQEGDGKTGLYTL